MRVLVTGGAGYVGSHTAKALAKAGFEPVVYDNLSVGRRCNVKWGPLVQAELCDRHQLDQILRKYDIRSVIHFAAHAYVGDSMQDPRRYFQNNVSNTLVLLDSLLEAGVDNFVFSSSCAVYGVPQVVPIPESHPKRPVSPYGESKLFMERVLDWYGAAYGLRTACLRYFNAAGADPEGELGEVHDPETHLIPRVIEAALGSGDGIDIYGTDYPTRDGTAIRDFVHVSDLAYAHVLALNCLLDGRSSFSANLGSGHGTSVREVIGAVERLSGVTINPRRAARRPGDPPVLIADPSNAMNLLGWHPQRSEIEDIVETALSWHRRCQVAAAAVGELRVHSRGACAVTRKRC
jgi:UDP-glucose-4-epimerase GalE